MTDDDRRARDRARQKRCRELRKQLKAGYWVVIDGDVINALIRWHWLRNGDETNPQCVSEALGRMLKDAAQR
jgi:hypothetical protein